MQRKEKPHQNMLIIRSGEPAAGAHTNRRAIMCRSQKIKCATSHIAGGATGWGGVDFLCSWQRAKMEGREAGEPVLFKHPVAESDLPQNRLLVWSWVLPPSFLSPRLPQSLCYSLLGVKTSKGSFDWVCFLCPFNDQPRLALLYIVKLSKCSRQGQRGHFNLRHLYRERRVGKNGSELAGEADGRPNVLDRRTDRGDGQTHIEQVDDGTGPVALAAARHAAICATIAHTLSAPRLPPTAIPKKGVWFTNSAASSLRSG